MRFYYQYFKLCNQKEFSYHLNSLFKMLNRFILLSVQIVIWKAVYNGSLTSIDSSYGKIGLDQMILYTIFSHLMYCMITNQTIVSINEKIKTGDIVFYLSKPYSFVGYQTVEALATSFSNVFLEGIPLLLISALLYRAVPTDGIKILLFLVACLFGWCINFLLSILCAGLAFWVVQTGPMHFLLDGVIKIFSGSMIPLWLFPEGMQKVIGLLPFSCIYFKPLSIITTDMPLNQCFVCFGQQLIWIVMLYVLVVLMFSKGEKKLMVQGG